MSPTPSQIAALSRFESGNAGVTDLAELLEAGFVRLRDETYPDLDAASAASLLVMTGAGKAALGAK